MQKILKDIFIYSWINLFIYLKMYRLLKKIALLDPIFGGIGYSTAIANQLYTKGQKNIATQVIEHNTLRYLTQKTSLIHKERLIRRINKEQKFEVNLEETLKKFINLADILQLKPFLAFGSLLGYVREKQLLEWDRDLDIGLIYEDFNIEQLIDLLKKNDFKVTIYYTPLLLCKIKCSLKTKFSPTLDIIFFHKQGDYLITSTDVLNDFLYRKRKPFDLQKIDFMNVPLYIPKNPEIFLDENYGEWRVPRKFHNYVLDSQLTDFEEDIVKYFAKRHFYKLLTLGSIIENEHYLKIFEEKYPDDVYWQKISDIFKTKSGTYTKK